jgi:hypothetical protein
MKEGVLAGFVKGDLTQSNPQRERPQLLSGAALNDRTHFFSMRLTRFTPQWRRKIYGEKIPLQIRGEPTCFSPEKRLQFPPGDDRLLSAPLIIASPAFVARLRFKESLTSTCRSRRIRWPIEIQESY